MFCLSLFRRCFGRYAEFHEEIPVEWEDRVSPISVVDSIDTTKVLNGCEKNKFSLGPDLEDGDCLQKGSFATVYRCTSKSPHLETEVAVKVYEFNYWSQDFRRESFRCDKRALCLNIAHANIVRFFGYFTVDEHDHYEWMGENVPKVGKACIVMELLRGPSLRVLQGQLDWTELKDIFLQLGSALEYLYEHHSMIHNDIRLDNVVLSGPLEHKPWRPILIDFGLAIVLSSTEYQRYERGDGTTRFSTELVDFAKLFMELARTDEAMEMARQTLQGLIHKKCTLRQAIAKFIE